MSQNNNDKIIYFISFTMETMNYNVSVSAVNAQFENSKLNKSNVKANKTFNPKDYLDTRLKPEENEKTVTLRILPVSATDHNFCVEIKTHSLMVNKEIAESGFKSFICLDDEKTPNYDSKVRCPLCSKSWELYKKAKELKNEGREQEADTIYKRANQLRNKTTYIVRCIDRNREAEGVKFWRFNKNSLGVGIYDELEKLYKNKQEAYKKAGKGDNYNIFDLENGRDIILTIKRNVNDNGTELKTSISVDADDFETPLTTDPELKMKWLTDEKQWYNAYATRTHDYLKVIAEGEVPYKLEDGTWTAKSEVMKQKSETEKETQQAIAEAQKILVGANATIVATGAPSNVTVNPVKTDVVDDLPF